MYKRQVVDSLVAPTGDPACNPGMYPDWDSDRRPFTSQSGAQSTEPHQPGLVMVIFNEQKNFCSGKFINTSLSCFLYFYYSTKGTEARHWVLGIGE